MLIIDGEYIDTEEYQTAIPIEPIPIEIVYGAE